MAYVNVAEWKTEQVCEWLKGLENSVLPYVHSFMNHAVNGQQLLSLRPEDLEQLGVIKLGHQEIILEAVEYLRNFHYELDRENMQLLALRLSCQAHSLHNELSRQTDSKPVTTQTLSDVASVMSAVKPLVRWLDRSPFSGQLEYNDKKTELMKLALEMATCAQRDRFAEKPIEEIRTICSQLAKLADYIIQDIADPMILQPASLDLATLKKKPGDDLGFYILPSFHGAHQIAEIKFGSAAHQCGKMEEGDEIVQVNYQTVVGWERKNLLELFRESPAEVLLTLKRRPRHTKVYGQIYIKPYRLPSNKKTSYTTRWQHNLPSPRPELLTIPDFTMPLPRHSPKNPSPEPTSILDTVNILDTMIIDSSDSDSEVEPPLSTRLYSSKPRNLVQRRATITGASPTAKHGIDIEQFWKELKQEHSTSFQLRDKAASCAHGLDNVSSSLRPQTCLGLEYSKRRKKLEGQGDDKKVQFQEKFLESDSPQANHTNNTLKGSKNENHFNGETVGIKRTITCVVETNNASDINVPIDECNNLIRSRTGEKCTISSKDSNVRNVKERGKLDKSYSTPTYDLTDDEDMEERKQKLLEQSFCIVESSNHEIKKSATVSITNKVMATPEIQVTVEDFDEQTKMCDKLRQNINISSTFNHNTTVKMTHSKNPTCPSGNVEDNHAVPPQLDLINNFVSDKRINNETSMGNTDTDINIADENTVQEAINTEGESASNSTIVNSYNSITGIHSNYDGNEHLSESDVISKNEQSAIPEEMSSNVQITDNVQSNEETFSECSIDSTENEMQNNKKLSKESTNLKVQESGTKLSEVAKQSLSQSCKYVEMIKQDTIRTVEMKSYSTPPDPPPRKHFTKPITNVSAENSSRGIDNKEQIAVLNKSVIKKSLKKPELCTESISKCSVNYLKDDSTDIYHNFMEKSTESINDIASTRNNIKSNIGLDVEFSNKQGRGEKLVCDKPETSTDKCPCVDHPSSNYYKPETYFGNAESLDSSLYFKQISDIKTKATEKDRNSEKGVVNKAMMVARSIGLHGSLSKPSNSSPRCSRKRNILFARKRNVSVRDLGPGDIEEWLTYRSRGAGGAWAKAWFVLKCSSLYRFKSQESTKADCLIALTGFTVSQATEVKSRRYAFKVYHTGTVFYFAADTEDSLAIWLDAINKATLGADGQNRSSALFSETDESEGESKIKTKNNQITENRSTTDKSFGSLKKVIKKDYKDHELTGASLDRKYLRFLGTKNQNVPVPTAQFRSYRRVIPSSTPNKKQETSTSPDLQMTIAGSTFYGLCTSQSTSDMTISTQDMGDYRQTSERCFTNRGRRVDDLQGFITLEEFMLSQQDEERRQTIGNQSVSPRVTPLTSDHVHVQHRNLHDSGASNEPVRYINEAPINNDVIHTISKTNNETTNNSNMCGYSRNIESSRSSRQANGDFSIQSGDSKPENVKTPVSTSSTDSYGSHKKKSQECSEWQIRSSYDNSSSKIPSGRQQSNSLYHSKSEIFQSSQQTGISHSHNAQTYTHTMEPLGNYDLYKAQESVSSRNINNFIDDAKSTPVKLSRKDGYSGSSSDLTSHMSCETSQRGKIDVTICRKGSFNLTGRRETISSDKHWLDSLRRTDKKNAHSEKNRLKNVAQYQPPPIPSSPFEQDGMRAAFEMHLDKGEHVHKTNRLKSLFGSKSQQKPCSLDLSKDTQKTLLGSPRLHRAIFRDKCSNQSQQRFLNRPTSQSPGDVCSSFNGTSPQALSQSFSSVSSASDWSLDMPSPSSYPGPTCCGGHPSCQKRLMNVGRNSMTPPTLPYIPPPTSPPPDYPGLQYPPVFEPGTYSLSDTSLLRSRNKDNQNNS